MSGSTKYTKINRFIKTKQYKKFVESCKACHRDQYIGLCYGPDGAGKTGSANYYTNWKKIEKHFQYNHIMETPPIPFQIKRLSKCHDFTKGRIYVASFKNFAWAQYKGKMPKRCKVNLAPDSEP